MMPLEKTSIAWLTSSKGEHLGSGFFANTERFGPVCVTCAHLSLDQKGNVKALINGETTALTYDAQKHEGADVALLAIPSKIATGVHIHSIGVAKEFPRIFYAHGWAPQNAFTQAIGWGHIWGVRINRVEVRNPSHPTRIYYQWVLRNDRKDLNTPFIPGRFLPGWSGAPVFNVVKAKPDKVVGLVTAVVADPGVNAAALSAESLDFLAPCEEQGEGEGAAHGLPSGAGVTIGWGRQILPPSVFRAKAVEILDEPFSFEAPRPPSPYDPT